MKPFRSLGLGLMVVLLVAGGAMAAGKVCKSDGKATVSGIVVDLGTILYTDGQEGWLSAVHWPGVFYATGLGTTWDAGNLHTPDCEVALRFKARLAGVRRFRWQSKTNVITLTATDVHGRVLASKTFAKRVGSPHTYSFALPKFRVPYCGNRQGGPVRLRLSFSKDDGAGGDDGTCSFSFKVYKGQN